MPSTGQCGRQHGLRLGGVQAGGSSGAGGVGGAHVGLARAMSELKYRCVPLPGGKGMGGNAGVWEGSAGMPQPFGPGAFISPKVALICSLRAGHPPQSWPIGRLLPPTQHKNAQKMLPVSARPRSILWGDRGGTNSQIPHNARRIGPFGEAHPAMGMNNAVGVDAGGHTERHANWPQHLP